MSRTPSSLKRRVSARTTKNKTRLVPVEACVKKVSIECNKTRFKESIEVRFIIGIRIGCVENVSFLVLVCYKKVRNEVGVKAHA